MTDFDPLAVAKAAGITFTYRDGRLTYAAPPSAAPVLATLKPYRAQIIAALTPPPRPPALPVARGTCVYGCPDARLYVCGWRCETHRPGAATTWPGARGTRGTVTTNVDG